MACTTILVGKNATYNGSTMISRNDDNGTGRFDIKKFTVVMPDQQPRLYRSVLSHVEIPLPNDPMRYTSVPNIDVEAKQRGLWAASGINAANVAMTATETITTNPRVLAADPMVEYVPASEGKPEKAGGIGEEDIVVLVLPYIHSAREGVKRLGSLLEEYGTYENNGIAFSDHDEVWYLETVGGHHWIARRLPDDCYSVIANEFSIDFFDLEDAATTQKNFMASPDLKDFIEENHLDLSTDGTFNARLAFGSHTDSDHVYNTPRVWYGQRYFNPSSFVASADDLEKGPASDKLAWCLKPENKITVEDIKYVLSATYQGTPYSVFTSSPKAGLYRPIGINRTIFASIAELRNDVPAEISAVEWISFGSNVYNTIIPVYTNINTVPAYLSNTTATVNTNNFYWCSRLIGALADPHHDQEIVFIERYQQAVDSQARAIMLNGERSFKPGESAVNFCDAQNQKICDMVQKETDTLLNQVLFTASMLMRNGYARADN
ncbi:C69 family dipeptidase [Erysipelotrichaceae bacterium RD49]|nr:C69 family dipeptidase [Erysipelotrichaceae bacterium RD49]